MRDGEKAARELEYAVKTLGMLGTMLPSDPADLDVAELSDERILEILNGDSDSPSSQLRSMLKGRVAWTDRAAEVKAHVGRTKKQMSAARPTTFTALNNGRAGSHPREDG